MHNRITSHEYNMNNGYIDNIHTLSEIYRTYKELSKQVEQRHMVSDLCALSRRMSAIECYILRQCTYIVYPAMSKSPKQLSNCLKRAGRVVQIVVMVSSVTSTLILLPLLNMKQVPRKLCLGYWPYLIKLSSQCSFTALEIKWLG